MENRKGVTEANWLADRRNLELERVVTAQLTNALDARRNSLKVYESLKSLNDVIGTQYGDRVLFELVQNAHDAHPQENPGEIAITLVIESDDRGELLVANRGRPFNSSNLESLRNIGTSDKQIGEGIGNKGLGFRSVEALTEDVHVYSAADPAPAEGFDGYCFRFARASEIQSKLIDLGADTDTARNVASNIPRYLIPIPVLDQSENVRVLARAGYATVVALPLRSKESIALARKQVEALIDARAPLLLFLDRIEHLNLSIRTLEGGLLERRLTRTVRPIETDADASATTLMRVTIDEDAFLVARRTLPKRDLLQAVQDSVAAAPPLKRWLQWSGDAIVSVAVPLAGDGASPGRLFNFLPMDERAVSPISGHIDAPFFADIDRRSIKPDLALNKYLLDAAAQTATEAALRVVDKHLDVPATAVIDLAAWSVHHLPRIVNAFAALGRPLHEACIWPIIPGGGASHAAFDTLFAWPNVKTRQLTPLRLAQVARTAILPTTIGDTRIARITALAAAVSFPLRPCPATLADWAEATAQYLSDNRRSNTSWRSFLDDIVALFHAVGAPLSALQGRKIFVDNDDKLLAAAVAGTQGTPPVFTRAGSERGRRSDVAPTPPSSLSRKFRFLQDGIVLADETLQAFEKGGLLKRYDPLEILTGIREVVGATASEAFRRDALLWSFRVWRSSSGKRVEDALRGANLHVPTLGGWHAVSEVVVSGTWTQLGRTLEHYLNDAAAVSRDCANQRDRLLISYADWPKASSDDRKEDWLRFLSVLGLVDGLRPIAGDVQAVATPLGQWHPLIQHGRPALGLDANWVNQVRGTSLPNPQTPYNLQGSIWRIPGQIEHSTLTETAKEALCSLIVGYLRDHEGAHFQFTLEHSRLWNRATLPTPLAVFLKKAAWIANVRGDEVIFATPSCSWSTTAVRQLPPRFIARFVAEAGTRAALPAILFDPWIGLRDWSMTASAPQRLAALAEALDDLSATERRDLRDQLRRAWSDVAEGKLELPTSLSLVIDHISGFGRLKADPIGKPHVHITAERQGFAARALADRGATVLDVGETDIEVILAAINATGAFTARLVDAGDVRLIVDGTDFAVNPVDPLLASGTLSWLADAAALAHEHLSDAFELRTLPPEEIEKRLRSIRLRRCTSFALVVDDQEIAARETDRVQSVPNAKVPTLIVRSSSTPDIHLLIDAASALTKLLGARRNTLEMILGRLARDGFTDAATEPTEEQYARAIRRDISVVRDYFAATRGGSARLARTLAPIVAHLQGVESGMLLIELQERHGPEFNLRQWLADKLGSDLAARCHEVTTNSDDQAVIRREMGFDFAAYSSTLTEMGYPPLNDVTEFTRMFGVYVAQLRPALVDRVRRRFMSIWAARGDLSAYVTLRRLDFIAFDPAWPTTLETLDRTVVEKAAKSAADAALGSSDEWFALPELEPTASANRKLIHTRYPILASLVRAWCRKTKGEPHHVMTDADPQQLVRIFDGAGFLDFEVLDLRHLPELCKRAGLWPDTMPTSDDLSELGLEQQDLDHEATVAREAKRRAEVSRRTILFGSVSLDTGDDAFSHLFESLADKVLSSDSGWYERSRAPRLLAQTQADLGASRGKSGRGGARGQTWHNQLPESIRNAMGIASEWLAREYLRRRHPAEMSDACWVSSNRTQFCTGDEGDDSLGYDFRVKSARREWLYEVKSALDEGGEFEMSARELEVAGSASFENKRRYRILYVPFVFDPTQWRVLPLSNPAAMKTRGRFRVVRSGSVRYHFDTR